MIIFMTLSVYFLIKFLEQANREKVSYKPLGFSAVLLSCAILTKSAMFYFPIIVMALIYAFYKRTIKRVILACLCILLSPGAVLSPWIVRNYSRTNRAIFASAPGFISPTRDSIVNKIGHTGEKV